jgi:hypothetical protein
MTNPGRFAEARIQANQMEHNDAKGELVDWQPDNVSLESGGRWTHRTLFHCGYDRHDRPSDDVPQPDGTHLVDRIEQITGFSLNGHTVTPTGFGTDYGLYFEFVDHNTGDFPPTFLSIDMTLKADPGDLNGPVVSDTSQTGFTNTGPTGQADDIVLAHGSLVSGMLFLDDTTTTPMLDATEVETFTPDIADFFKGGSDVIKGVASNPVTLLTMTDVSDVGTVTNFNNHAGHIQFVQDPAGNGHAFGCGHTDG